LKLEKLRLIAYGPFTGVELDLSSPGICVVYGKNEAGKSTALRAITGLLYGIARNTTDAHLHRMPELRVGGTVRGADGATIEVVRRKGKDNTLLDREGRPVDETALSRFFGGVTQEQFLGMFGLDHESLRRGGEALLLGGGNVGESLFAATMAGGELHRVLRDLAAEADALFTPKGYTKPLNEALKSFAEAEKRTREQSTSPEAMREQTRGLAELRRDQEECESKRQRLALERTKLERLRRALPLLAKRRTASERRRAIGEAPLLPPSASAEHADLARVVDGSEREIARLTTLTSDLTERRDALSLPESLVRYDDVPLDIAHRLGSYLRALIDLPRLEAEIEEQDEQAKAALRRAGRDPSRGAAEVRTDATLPATVQRLAVQIAQFREAKSHVEENLVEQRARRGALLARRDALAPGRDATSLKKAVSRAERDGPIEERLARARAERARIEEKARVELGGLGLEGRSLGDVVAMAVPAIETIERFAARRTALEQEARQIADRRNARAAQLNGARRDVDALERAGHVPSEDDLSEARARRDALWGALRGAMHGEGAPGTETIAAYEAGVRTADDLADRLRREAERVSRLAALRAECEAAARDVEEDGTREAAIARALGEESAAFRAIFAQLGIDPHPPLEMKPWAVRHAALARTADALRDAEREVTELALAVERHRQSLSLLLLPNDGAARDSRDDAPGRVPLAELLDRASDLAASLESAMLERRQIEREIAEQDDRLRALEAREREQDLLKAELDREWRAAIEPLGLAATASPEQVTATLELLEKAAHHEGQAATVRRQKAALEREMAAFRADVERLANEHAPDLIAVSADRAAAEIVDRYHRGRSALAARRELDRQLEHAARDLGEQRDRQRAALEKVGEMMRVASVDSMAALESAVRMSDERRALETELERLAAELGELGGAAELEAEAGDSDADTVTLRLGELDQELEELRESASMIDRRIGSAEAGLKDLQDPKAKAADAALDAEAALARVHDLAMRYLRARTASIVLSREIEIYRQKNQGPILTRASEIFARLTLGSFSALRTDFDHEDKPILVGVRTSGGDVATPAMSDGTRDQLYLALRVATLERFAQQGNPMPMVLDDILVHFDDERARAALEVLGELANRAQILFFTHHARLVELARETLAPSGLTVRELDRQVGRGSVGAGPGALLGSARK
jgi:uncharacterized protein YhaN